MQKQVNSAKPYKLANMGSHGKASSMFIRQFNFPDTYNDELDSYESNDHDLIMRTDSEHSYECFKRHTHSTELLFETWALKAYDQKIIIFLKDIMRADSAINWTGYRIRGTVNVDNGFPVWTLELFAKHPNSDTVVYTGEKAPNVRK
jgi:hypothetical protein